VWNLRSWSGVAGAGMSTFTEFLHAHVAFVCQAVGMIELGALASCACDFFRKTLPHLAARNCASWLLRSWSRDDTRAYRCVAIGSWRHSVPSYVVGLAEWREARRGAGMGVSKGLQNSQNQYGIGISSGS
jgi:hypothetical protein